jgi:hypothetical protein
VSLDLIFGFVLLRLDTGEPDTDIAGCGDDNLFRVQAGGADPGQAPFHIYLFESSASAADLSRDSDRDCSTMLVELGFYLRQGD